MKKPPPHVGGYESLLLVVPGFGGVVSALLRNPNQQGWPKANQYADRHHQNTDPTIKLHMRKYSRTPFAAQLEKRQIQDDFAGEISSVRQ
jgi:hypothetical protein